MREALAIKQPQGYRQHKKKVVLKIEFSGEAPKKWSLS